jgi:hypothetical protein
MNEEREALLKELGEAVDPGQIRTNFGHDPRVPRALNVLVKSILLLDETSGKLARTNIRLTTMYTVMTAVLLVIGIIQIVLMVRGH